ncbi:MULTISPECIES: DUF2330 domain-containing protein [unclassified Streptomyces]|uniref:DUF2330 domain-containing protein n=1 Tax=unclassified Streptomyces TaxID=2593676 RepID=UPI002259CA66|nr:MULTISPECIES: DUF2330 domain-containing protein [unclassified Streptomyces]MCX4524249.1 DUF2330 domain-containing protein [Streptomyces sp. NBC_01551]MCX4545231.1 DUF2330 domain-containing protein [Streptomyces sp. NBC_01565]
MKRRILALLFALLATQVGSLVSPAYACGCGAMIPDRMSRIGVDRETSVVRWDGATEQIVMRFTVGGDAKRAAWVMPVPHRATVELGDPTVFDQLTEMTRPERRTRTHFWPRGGDWPFSSDIGDGATAALPGAGAPSVDVVGREQLGDFDVARLTATDPDALRDWLESNGFTLPDRLATELRPYVDQKWEYVAVRLAPRRPGKPLLGTLDPLRIRFESDRLVYPMRLSRMAKTAQSLGLYVLADHRMEPSSPIGGNTPEVTFAGRITPRDGLAELTGGKPAFLTAIDQRFPDPGRIDGDHELRATAADTPYRRVVYRDRLLTVGDDIPVWLLTAGGGLLAVAAAVGLRVRRARGVRRATA